MLCFFNYFYYLAQYERMSFGSVKKNFIHDNLDLKATPFSIPLTQGD